MPLLPLILLALSPTGGTGEPVVVQRGEGRDALVIPEAEELVYQVEIDVGLLGDLDVGRVTLTTGQEPYRAGLPVPGEKVAADPKLRVGWIRSEARGSYLGYELNHELESRHLPQTWPSVLYRDTQKGSESRRRELKLGVHDGKPSALYRSDGHCKGCENREHFVESGLPWGEPSHCKKCKRGEHRVWSEPKRREIAPDSVDLLTAVYLARAMVREGKDAATFPIIDKQKQWILTITRGRTAHVETPAGKFPCVLALLESRIPPGEPVDNQKFEGLFGIQGTIKIWMEVGTGIPVLISGELPVPVIRTLDLNVGLRSFRGTPSEFAPIR